jgi:hypothetical protein
MFQMDTWVRGLTVIAVLSLIYLLYGVCEIIDHYYYGIRHITRYGRLLFLTYPIVALLGALWIIHGIRRKIK